MSLPECYTRCVFVRYCSYWVIVIVRRNSLQLHARTVIFYHSGIDSCQTRKRSGDSGMANWKKKTRGKVGKHKMAYMRCASWRCRTRAIRWTCDNKTCEAILTNDRNSTGGVVRLCAVCCFVSCYRISFTILRRDELVFQCKSSHSFQAKQRASTSYGFLINLNWSPARLTVACQRLIEPRFIRFLILLLHVVKRNDDITVNVSDNSTTSIAAFCIDLLWRNWNPFEAKSTWKRQPKVTKRTTVTQQQRNRFW